MFGVFSFLCFSSEALQLVKFGGSKVLTAEKDAADSSNTEEGRIVTSTCLELFTGSQ